MCGSLYVIGTPIGNLEDITLRQLRVLKETVDFIAAEDTRVTRKLLSHYEIKKQLISYHQHSTQAVLMNIIERISNGENCGIVTDAGMPCISDPGEPLVKMCHERNIKIVVIPGPSAVVSALAISGQNTARFTFEGFLSVNKKIRTAHLESLENEERTMIFYEAPHKLVKTLSDMAKHFGADRSISFCRELTKIHEEVRITTLGEALNFYEISAPKGEFVLVVAGKEKPEKTEYTLDEAVSMTEEKIKQGMKTTSACKEVSAETGIPKSEIYNLLHK
jgi:16S rRNA (cytidine1402-2'-O)-methyltransferase